jgi:thioredoxin 1
MDWKDGLSPAALERLTRVGALSAEEKAAVAEQAELDDTLRMYFSDEISDGDLLARLKGYEASARWSMLRAARDRLNASFKSANLPIAFTEGTDGSVVISSVEVKTPSPLATPQSTVVELTDDTFDGAVHDHALLVVDCWAAWCGPCRAVAPVIEELARDYAGRITFAKLDVDKNRATAARFNIQSIPTILIFKKGRLVDQKLGAMPKAMLEPAVKKHLPTDEAG